MFSCKAASVVADNSDSEPIESLALQNLFLSKGMAPLRIYLHRTILPAISYVWSRHVEFVRDSGINMIHTNTHEFHRVPNFAPFENGSGADRFFNQLTFLFA